MSNETSYRDKYDLFDQWSKLDDRALAKNPLSIRLPIHLLARLDALGEIFSGKSRSAFIVDLLNSALSTLEESMPVDGNPDELYDPDPSFNWHVGRHYREFSNNHYRKLAKEAKITIDSDLFPPRKKKV